MIDSYIYLFLGFVALFVGGEMLIRGAVGMSARLRVSTLIIGSTVVAFGTSMPELTVSLSAVMMGSSDISVGNVVGSNVANIALVLGVTIMIFPLRIERGTMLFEWPMVILGSAVLFLLAFDFQLSRFDGFVLLTILVFYLIKNFQSARASRRETRGMELPGLHMSLWKGIFLVAAGIGALVFGSQWLVDGAVDIARVYGVSERVIGISLVAFGTSLPELATSVIAAFRKQHDISVGNLLGSNIFNICCILGITSAFQPIPVSPATLDTDFIWMVIIAFAILPFFLYDSKLKRWEGLLLFAAYCWYIISEFI